MRKKGGAEGQLVNVEGIVELENHRFAIIIISIGSGKSH